MATSNTPLAVPLDAQTRRRIEKAAGLLNLPAGAFLAESGDERARSILRDWAVARYQEGERTFSQLAEETGLAVEEIMLAMGATDREGALDAFIARCRSLSERYDSPEFLRLAEQAVARIRTETR